MMSRRIFLALPLVSALVACDTASKVPQGDVLLATVSRAHPEAGLMLRSTEVLRGRSAALAPAQRWGEGSSTSFYVEVRGQRGRLLWARGVVSTDGARTFQVPIPLRQHQPTELELFALSWTDGAPAKVSLGRLALGTSAPRAMAALHAPPRADAE